MSRWDDIKAERASRDPGFEEGVARERALLDLERKLYTLRRGRGITQVMLGDSIGMTQEGISRIERAEDLRLSTLAGYISGLGGHLELRAVFDDDDPVVLTGELPPMTPRSRGREVPANSDRRFRA